MNFTVLYTPKAKETLLLVSNFIENEFGLRSAKIFLTKAAKTIKILSTQPYMFKATPMGEHIRVAYITKQTSVFYQVTDKSIILLFFWNNRLEPFFNSY